MNAGDWECLTRVECDVTGHRTTCFGQGGVGEVVGRLDGVGSRCLSSARGVGRVVELDNAFGTSRGICDADDAVLNIDVRADLDNTFLSICRVLNASDGECLTRVEGDVARHRATCFGQGIGGGGLSGTGSVVCRLDGTRSGGERVRGGVGGVAQSHHAFLQQGAVLNVANGKCLTFSKGDDSAHRAAREWQGVVCQVVSSLDGTGGCCFGRVCTGDGRLEDDDAGSGSSGSRLGARKDDVTGHRAACLGQCSVGSCLCSSGVGQCLSGVALGSGSVEQCLRGFALSSSSVSQRLRGVACSGIGCALSSSSVGECLRGVSASSCRDVVGRLDCVGSGRESGAGGVGGVAQLDSASSRGGRSIDADDGVGGVGVVDSDGGRARHAVDGTATATATCDPGSRASARVGQCQDLVDGASDEWRGDLGACELVSNLDCVGSSSDECGVVGS